jgi:hypothetical protein
LVDSVTYPGSRPGARHGPCGNGKGTARAEESGRFRVIDDARKRMRNRPATDRKIFDEGCAHVESWHRMDRINCARY